MVASHQLLARYVSFVMEKTKRPDLLSALCFLTFIGSSIAFVMYFLASIFFEKSTEIIINYSSWSSVEKISPMYFTFLMVLYALSLVGAIRMWKLHRGGFYLYLIVQLIILFFPAVWIDSEAFSTTNAIFTIVFIAGYSMNIRHLK